VTTEEPDRIELRGLRLTVLVGVLPEERERAQPVEVDLDIEVDTSAAGASDDLDDSVDYGAVVALVEQVLGAGHQQLLERQAAIVAEAVLATDDRIAAVRVAVRKLRPPVPQDLATAGVSVLRRRS
jgi:7,8-dihydroneopterin aldolase/epimerase/oxygenase